MYGISPCVSRFENIVLLRHIEIGEGRMQSRSVSSSRIALHIYSLAERRTIGWRVCIVTITSSQVFTTTRRHRTHLYLSSRRARPYVFVCMHGMLRYATVVSSTLRVSQQRREWRNLRAVSEDSLRIGQF